MTCRLNTRTILSLADLWISGIVKHRKLAR